MSSEAERAGAAPWHCQIVRIREGGALDRLVRDYIRDQLRYTKRRRVSRAQAIRELLASCIPRKRRTLPEPEQMALFAQGQREGDDAGRRELQAVLAGSDIAETE
jgi:hypothetical protein